MNNKRGGEEMKSDSTTKSSGELQNFLDESLKEKRTRLIDARSKLDATEFAVNGSKAYYNDRQRALLQRADHNLVDVNMRGYEHDMTTKAVSKLGSLYSAIPVGLSEKVLRDDVAAYLFRVGRLTRAQPQDEWFQQTLTKFSFALMNKARQKGEYYNVMRHAVTGSIYWVSGKISNFLQECALFFKEKARFFATLKNPGHLKLESGKKNPIKDKVVNFKIKYPDERSQKLAMLVLGIGVLTFYGPMKMLADRLRTLTSNTLRIFANTLNLIMLLPLVFSAQARAEFLLTLSDIGTAILSILPEVVFATAFIFLASFTSLTAIFPLVAFMSAGAAMLMAVVANIFFNSVKVGKGQSPAKSTVFAIIGMGLIAVGLTGVFFPAVPAFFESLRALVPIMYVVLAIHNHAAQTYTGDMLFTRKIGVPAENPYAIAENELSAQIKKVDEQLRLTNAQKYDLRVQEINDSKSDDNDEQLKAFQKDHMKAQIKSVPKISDTDKNFHEVYQAFVAENKDVVFNNDKFLVSALKVMDACRDHKVYKSDFARLVQHVVNQLPEVMCISTGAFDSDAVGRLKAELEGRRSDIVTDEVAVQQAIVGLYDKMQATAASRASHVAAEVSQVSAAPAVPGEAGLPLPPPLPAGVSSVPSIPEGKGSIPASPNRETLLVPPPLPDGGSSVPSIPEGKGSIPLSQHRSTFLAAPPVPAAPLVSGGDVELTTVPPKVDSGHTIQ